MTTPATTHAVEVRGGVVDVADTGGDGPVVVLLHGFLMDPTLWDAVVADLRRDHRCVLPTLPLGAHRRPVRSDADLSLPGIAAMVCDLLDALDLVNVTLVGNDTGGAVAQLVAADAPPRVARLLLASCEAFDNIPPGLTGRTLALAGRLPPPLFRLVMEQLRLRPMRRLPLTFGWLTRRGDATTRKWLQPVLDDRAIRADAVRAIRSVMRQRRVLDDAVPRLREFDRPTRVVWAERDRVMPPEHGRRLAELLPNARLVEIADTRTLIPLDQPQRLAAEIRALTRA